MIFAPERARYMLSLEPAVEGSATVRAVHIASIDGVSKSYDGRSLFSGLSFGITSDDRIGIVGRNGSGKSTLLAILAGRETVDAGRVVFQGDVSIAFLEQEPDHDPTQTIDEVVMAGQPVLVAALQRYDVATQRLSVDPEDAGAVEALARATATLDRLDGWTVEHKRTAILDRLGFDDSSVKLGSLSGGQRRRVALAAALVSDADLLILDEPTNHLDADAVDWLERELAGRNGPLVMVTHDRFLLERLTNVMIELDDGHAYRHDGTYSDLLTARLERTRQTAAAEARRNNALRKEIAWLRRGARARTSKPKFRLAQVEALQSIGTSRELPALDLGTGRRRLGKRAIQLDGVSAGYDGRSVVRNVELNLGPGDRIGIVGANGTGKTTLLRLIAGEIEGDGGVIWRSPNCVIGMYCQTATVEADGRRAIEVITDVGTHIPLVDGSVVSATKLAERFGFDAAMQHRQIADLSGGERRRLALLEILMDAPNVLLLDEPTNDLDVETLAVLEDYLDGFGGVLVVASHDRYLLDRLTDVFYDVNSRGGLDEHVGDWESYRGRRDAAVVAAKAKAKSKSRSTPARKRPSNATGGSNRSSGRELERLGSLVAALESKKASAEAELESCRDYEAAGRLGAAVAAIAAELSAAEDRWLEASLS